MLRSKNRKKARFSAREAIGEQSQQLVLRQTAGRSRLRQGIVGFHPVALAQLRRLPGFLERRSHIREQYVAGLDGSPVIVPHFGFARMSREGDKVGHHIMPVILPVGTDRAAVMARLKERGIQTSIHYPCVHRFSAFAGTPAAGLERTEALAVRELTLPMFPTMREDQVRLVCRELRDALAA